MIKIKCLPRLFLSIFATTSILLGGKISDDSAIAQQVINVAPSGQQDPQNLSIAWQFDNTSLVNPQSIRVFLNNQDVTNQSILDVNRNFFGFRPNQTLATGNYEVLVQFTNTQGSSFNAKWQFSVASPRTALEINSVTHNAVQPLGTGATFLATIKGTPGAKGSFLIATNDSNVDAAIVPASEVSSGIYVASDSSISNISIREGVLVGRLEKNGEVIFGAANQPFVIKAGATTNQVTQTQTSNNFGQVNQTSNNPNFGQVNQFPNSSPLTLAVTSHNNNSVVQGGNGFTLSGITSPNAVIKVTAVASPPQFGPFSLGTPETLVNDQFARVDANGQYSIMIPRPLIVQSNTQYVVSVTASRGNEIQKIVLNLTHQ